MDFITYITLPLLIFFTGLAGIFLNRRNIIIMIMSIELMLLAVNFDFILFSIYLGDRIGQVFSLFILTVAAAESAIGLAILVAFYRSRNTLSVEKLNLLKG
uniref:NADH dehydrogenase subunit 4L n=2 Tax=Pavlovaceae TaxID=418969 RepID=E9P698_DIALT|nr:NADH dehydrogenase subunit 4L [Diacronema lutheri]QHD45378.1 NADH dehydrogenase subunit 4L [Pavlova sp. NIVA-4/92]